MKRRRTLNIIASLIVCLLSVTAADVQPVAAISMGDYFSCTYEVSLDKSEVAGDEIFQATAYGKATCKKDLPVEVSKVEITSRVVARHQDSSAVVTLNPGYTVTISPCPSRKGEAAEVSETVLLQFAKVSQPGTYEVIAELIEARVKAVVWFTVTDYLPASKPVGSVIYSISQSAPHPSLPDTSSFIINNLKLEPTETHTGEEVVVSALVTNMSECAGSHEVALKLSGVMVASKVITLEAGASAEVAFPIVVNTPGSYTVGVNDVSDTLTVHQQISMDEIDIVDSDSNYGLFIALAVAGFVIVGLIIWLVSRRCARRYRKV
ncbi:MAG: hypothetical protein PHU23_02075 [Dehalococcoidales bacterium]|nr:hypothetical protein [Dehalococcoidales bacterium]